MKFYLLKRSINFPKYSWSASHVTGKFDGDPIIKHQNTGPTERQNLAL